MSIEDAKLVTRQQSNLKFWIILASVMVAVAIAVTLIDLGIKASILAEAEKVRSLLNDSGAEKPANSRDSSLANSNGNLLDFHDAGVENSDVPDLSKAILPQDDKSPRKRNTPRAPNRDREVSQGD